ncbi:MAG: lysophospholipid acyltransferase family protein [Desulfohalobiaceae bacterium]|nr:lysophospholipid acyltransferase family protein [Desulfohalobiaceae bacterium]
MKSLLYQGLSVLTQRLSLQQKHRAGRWLGRMMWRLLPKRRKLATEAIALHLGQSRDQAAQSARESFQQAGCAFLELFANRTLDHRFLQEHVHIADPDRFFAVLKTERPIVTASGHFGAWELLAGVFNLASGSRPAQIIAYYPKDRELNRLLIHLRQHAGTEIVSNRRTTGKISRCLRQNGISGFLVDHNCTRRKAVFLPFLEKTAAVNMGPAYLALLNKALVWPVFLRRDGNGQYTLNCQEPLDTCSLSGSKEEKIKAIADFYTRAVQKQLLQAPEQWLWMHDRWKTQPKETTHNMPKRHQRRLKMSQAETGNDERGTGNAELETRNAERRTRMDKG